MAAGFSESESTSLLRKAVDIACQARDHYFEKAKHGQGLRPLVAASIGPYGAYLADGSEFRGNYSISAQELQDFHEPRWKILQATDADLFAIETIPSYTEAGVLLDLLEQTPNLSAWISFSCTDGSKIHDGTLLADCAGLFKDCNQVVAIGVNCTAPRNIPSLIGELCNAVPEKQIIVYPNSGEVFDARQKTWVQQPDPADFGTAAAEWFGLGARLIGGCCRTGPDHITQAKNTLLGC
jgi:homocysteine S-methyltransferase